MTLYKRFFLSQFVFVILFFLNINLAAQSEGEQIFKSNCAACHTIGGGKLIGPDAKEWLSSDRFVSTDDPLGTLVKYVQNPADFGVLEMPAQALTAGEIKQVLDYVDGYVPEVKEVVTSIEVAEEESTNPVIILLIVTLILFLLILVLVSVKNNLKESLSLPTETVFESFKNYVTINRNKIIIGFVLFISLMYLLYNLMMGVGVVEKYQPDQPIAFSHELHAGLNGVDCNYCHSSAKNSAHSGVPSANVCMNCHAVVKGGDDKAKNEIGKIWKSFGLDIETDDFDWNKLDTYQQTPIEWIRVHNLPDHAYFNHAQHVTVGGLECQQCHGNMQEKTVGQVATAEELNKIDYNIKDGIEFDHPTLTMGWCIDCHRQKEVDMEGNDYYTEMHKNIKEKHEGVENFTVDMIGGLECGKCHY
ncbi:MAG: hypothetical protein CMD02_05225 [Flavobacteriales bacterium]|nr:hypothetical protein [Flavobacteriales bacterium]